MIIKIFTFFILLFILFIIFLLIVPFHIIAEGEYENRFYGVMKITWLWNLLHFEYFFMESKISIKFAGMRVLEKINPKDKPVRQENIKKTSKKKPDIFNSIFEMLRISKKIWRSLSPKGALQGIIGFDNPATTGEMMGMYYAFTGWPDIPVNIDPDFSGSRIFLKGYIKVLIFIGSLLMIFLGELLTPEGRKLLRNIRKEQ